MATTAVLQCPKCDAPYATVDTSPPPPIEGLVMHFSSPQVPDTCIHCGASMDGAPIRQLGTRVDPRLLRNDPEADKMVGHDGLQRLVAGILGEPED